MESWQVAKWKLPIQVCQSMKHVHDSHSDHWNVNFSYYTTIFQSRQCHVFEGRKVCLTSPGFPWRIQHSSSRCCRVVVPTPSLNPKCCTELSISYQTKHHKVSKKCCWWCCVTFLSKLFLLFLFKFCSLAPKPKPPGPGCPSRALLPAPGTGSC